MPATLTKNEETLELSLSGCRGGEFQDAKEKIKQVAGRRFDFERKVWVVPADPLVAERILKTIQPTADDALLAWVREARVSHEESLTSPLPKDTVTLSVPWAYTRLPWQPEVVNDEAYDGLLPHQRSAVEAMATRGRAVLADDLGLAKTFTSISAVEEYCLRNGQVDGPRLVVAPASVVGSWKRELNRWLDSPPLAVIDAKSPQGRHEQLQAGIANNSFCLTNWEQLRVKKIDVALRNGGKKKMLVMKEPLFEYPQAHELGLSLDDLLDPATLRSIERRWGAAEPGWLAVIADEVHRAKNRDAQQTKGLHRTRGKVMFGLSGTPILNSPDELWSILRWLWPEQYHEAGNRRNAVAYWAFYNDFVEYWEDHLGHKVVTGVKNPDALRFALKDKVIRRTAALLGLKGRKRIYYQVDLNPKQKKLYEEAEEAMWLAIEKAVAEGNEDAARLAAAASDARRLWPSIETILKIPNGAARFVRLQQIIESPALIGGEDDSALMDDLEQKYVDSRPEPWVVFCKYKESCNLVAARLRKHGANVAVYNGDVTTADRTEIEDAFQRGEYDCVVGTIAAMYQGITLTRSHLVYFLSREVVPAVNDQAEARLDRLGQQELVRVMIPQAVGTVAVGKVSVTNRLKESIERTVLPKDRHKEEHL